jgi:alpha/beta superfamily hydrolase
MHGNCSSRCEATGILKFLLPMNMTLFAFDFSGCGKSEGDYISLGWYEKDDLGAVVKYLRNSGTVSTIGL